MSKTLGSWSGMRKYLEQEMLADSVKGRIRYNCTTYVGMDGCKIFEVFLDNKLLKQFSWETVQSYFIKNGLAGDKPKPMSIPEYWMGFFETLEAIPMDKRSEYTDGEFCAALEAYRSSDISASLSSPDPIQRMFAVLDRRTGKRTLMKMKETLSAAPDWLNTVISARLEAECIK